MDKDSQTAAPRLAITTILIAALALIVMVVVGVYATASRIDAAARAREKRLVSNGLQLEIEQVRASLTPNTVWDEAVAHLDVKLDPKWAEGFIGEYFWHTNGYPQVFVLDRDGKPVFAFQKDRVVAPGRFSPFAADAVPLISQIRQMETARGPPPSTTSNPPPIDAGEIVRVDGADYVLAGSLVQTDNSSGVHPSRRAPIVMVAAPIDQAFLDRFARRYLLQDLRLEPAGHPDPAGSNSAPLEADEPVESDRLAWRPSSPISHLLVIVGPLMISAFLVLGGGGALLIRHERRRNQALLVAMRQARQASDAKSTFLATISHEIRTPLNGVLGMAQAMEHDPLSPAQRERIGVIRQSGSALLEVLNNVLDLSKIEAGMLSLESVDFDLEAVALSAKAAFGAVAASKDVALEVEIEPGARGLYCGDPVRVRQVIYNLVANGLKFTETGSVKLIVAAGETGVSLTVRDTGIGIAPDQVEHLFDKFVQADSSTTRRYGGTGLGLAICRELCDAMGGTIRVESEIGVGSAFMVELPLTPVASHHNSKAPTAAAPEGGAMAALRVLAAEDNAVNQLVLRTLLDQIGVAPRLVANGAEAVEAFSEQSWDLILMDVQMPVMDGVEAARRIRAIETERGASATPIIALTANAMAHQIALYLEAGMDGHLSKPIEIERLFELIAKVSAPNLSTATA